MDFDFRKLRSNFQLKDAGTERRAVPEINVELNDVSDDQSAEKRALSIQSLLRNLGYVPTINSDGDLAFKANGRQFLILLDNDTFYRIVVPGIDVVRGEDEDAMKKINDAFGISRELKFVKICIDEDMFSMCYEGFYDSVDDFNSVLERMIDFMSKCVLRYCLNVVDR